MKLIKINTDHYIIIDDSEIKEGDWVYNISSKTLFPATKSLIDLINSPNVELTTNKKITHSTQPLEQENEHVGWDKVKHLNLSYCKQLVGEVDVEKKAQENCYQRHQTYNSEYTHAYIEGYHQSLSDNKGKLFTLSDIQNAWGIAYMNGICEDDELTENITFIDFISSLTQSQETWEVEFINGQLKLK